MRPLTATSENPEDNNIIPLTPCHLIIGNAINPLPSEIYSHEEKERKTPKDLKERWKERKQVSAHYWNLWREEYLTTLRKLTKNYCAKRDIKEGDVVLDLLDRTTKLEWPIRVVHEALKARAPGEKEPKGRSLLIRYSIPTNKVTDEDKHLIQHK